MEFFKTVAEWMNENPGKAAGTIAGIVIGLLIIIFGPLNAIFVIVLGAIGFLVGKLRDENISITEQIRRFLKRDR
jgi:uncharacterized membrane protein